MTNAAPSTEVATVENVGKGLSDETLADMKSFSDALTVLEKSGIIAETFADYGTGFQILPTTEKSRLLKVPFLIVEWRFTNGDNGEFVSAAIVTQNDEKLIINDGSTGIRDQLRMVTNRRIAKGHAEPQKALLVANGLTVSEYDYVNDKGEVKKAKTYYLSN